jgi:hypothetical protein
MDFFVKLPRNKYPGSRGLFLLSLRNENKKKSQLLQKIPRSRDKIPDLATLTRTVYKCRGHTAQAKPAISLFSGLYILNISFCIVLNSYLIQEIVLILLKTIFSMN